MTEDKRKIEVETAEPHRHLVLRHASERSSGTWGPDDYDVIDSHGETSRSSMSEAGRGAKLASETLRCTCAHLILSTATLDLTGRKLCRSLLASSLSRCL